MGEGFGNRVAGFSMSVESKVLDGPLRAQDPFANSFSLLAEFNACG